MDNISLNLLISSRFLNYATNRQYQQVLTPGRLKKIFLIRDFGCGILDYSKVLRTKFNEFH